jgi:hypothetical protein
MPEMSLRNRGPKSPSAWLARTVAALSCAFVLSGGALAATAPDPLAAAYAAALAAPTDIQAQLRYARAAEASGKLEAAFPVYERVLVLQPTNAEAQAGLRRIRAEIQPSRNDTLVELGAAFESNPLRVPTGENPEFQLYGNVDGTYEQSVAATRMRTVVRLAGIWHDEQSGLNYGYAGLLTGPVIDMGAASDLHVALGGGISTFGGRLFYTEAQGQLTYETARAGATQSLRLRTAFREYDPSWVSTSGFWADLTGKFIWTTPQAGVAVTVKPWLRWSGVPGTFAGADQFNNLIDVTPGRYEEAGGTLDYSRAITSWLSLDANISLVGRRYTSDVVPLTTTAREDFTVSPGVAAVFPSLIGNKTDLRLRYNFLFNNSNDDSHDYRDNVVTLSAATKF